ncbi:hypothetical protein [Sphingobium sp.]|uniref:hypothetical protein n=1 Tax=Sphingobium sp. TaxID=1912891 RepID=UPI000DAF7250|nr:hypothetical protein [Sphingobium sp.]PZU64012.1 MAG: hypothetical protein DI540_21705 [Sphingobium sp.]
MANDRQTAFPAPRGAIPISLTSPISFTGNADVAQEFLMDSPHSGVLGQRKRVRHVLSRLTRYHSRLNYYPVHEPGSMPALDGE